MKKILILFLLFTSVTPMFANISKDRLEHALECYNLENYNDAKRDYEILLSEGNINPIIYYNLSVIYLKNNEIGNAVLNIERALRLAPRDKNSILVKNYISKLMNDKKQNIAERFLERIKLAFSLNEIVIIFFILFIVLCISLSLYFFLYKKIYLKIFFVFLALIIVLFPFLYLKIDAEILNVEAIVLVSSDVRNKPIKSEEASFEISEGTKVLILSELGKWVKVKSYIDGLSGWIDKHSLERI